MKIDHVALYVKDLELIRKFYETYFGAKSNSKYYNPKTGLQTYFLTFDDSCRIEIMNKPEIADIDKTLLYSGYTHLAFNLGSKIKVDQLTITLQQDGYKVISEPRTTGDGYYESCVLDPENNRIEIVE